MNKKELIRIRDWAMQRSVSVRDVEIFMDAWRTAPDPECGTVGCILGTFMMENGGQFVSNNGLRSLTFRPSPVGEFHPGSREDDNIAYNHAAYPDANSDHDVGWTAVAEFFDITFDQAHVLFHQSHYPDGYSIEVPEFSGQRARDLLATFASRVDEVLGGLHD